MVSAFGHCGERSGQISNVGFDEQRWNFASDKFVWIIRAIEQPSSDIDRASVRIGPIEWEKAGEVTSCHKAREAVWILESLDQPGIAR